MNHVGATDRESSTAGAAAPAQQFRDKERNEPATDRDTGTPLVEVTVALTVEGGQPQVLRVSVPQPGVPKDLVVGQVVRPAGLTSVAGEKNGRAWQIFRAKLGRGEVRMTQPHDLDLIRAVPAVVLGMFAVTVAVWLAGRAVRYLLTDKQVRPASSRRLVRCRLRRRRN